MECKNKNEINLNWICSVILLDLICSAQVTRDVTREARVLRANRSVKFMKFLPSPQLWGIKSKRIVFKVYIFGKVK